MTTPLEQLDQVMSVRDAAKILKTSPQTVYELIRSGRLKAKRLGFQKVWRISAKALQTFLDTPDNAS